METLFAYLPPDRRQAIATNNELPHQARGSVLWADLSGFTSLTEKLAQKFGLRRGAEELGLYLNHFYNAIIAPIDLYAGSVVDFSGDAITCWFDDDNGQRAIVAGEAMQAAMKSFTSLKLDEEDEVFLGLKIAIASGPVYRLKVGNPAIQMFDVLAGITMERLSIIGHLAATGELLLDEQTEYQLHSMLQISEWRKDLKSGQRAAVLSSSNLVIAPVTELTRLPKLIDEQIRPWLLPQVFLRLAGKQGEFLTELRPAAALFIRFNGLDYERDEKAADKLNVVVQHLQEIVLKYEGALLQLTIGDKGNYVYAAFGAPIAHEDDIVRAASAALDASLLPAKIDFIHSVSIGLSQGIMRTGAYGGTTRRTYGVLGNEVNMAARLMEQAENGQILANETFWKAAHDFDWQFLPEMTIRGKETSIRPAILLRRQEQGIAHLTETITALPMIGRRVEQDIIHKKLELACQGTGQIVSITGEAGMGKSRLLMDVLHYVDDLPQYSGECQSFGTQSSYLMWHSVWRAFFRIGSVSSLDEKIILIEKMLTNINPNFSIQLPLMGAILNLSIPDNDFTSEMDARSRKETREALLVDCIRSFAHRQPLVLIFEDVHWIDPLSRDLLELVGQAIKNLPVFILLTYRPPAHDDAVLLPGIQGQEHFTEVHLVELTGEETKQLITTRLAHFGLQETPTRQMIERLSVRTQGNPFYTEELLNYLHDRGFDLRHDDTWSQADLPDSLHSLILSRIDQLSERQQITIKAASIIGRLFQAAWLYGYYPPLGGAAQVAADLELLNRLNFTIRETPAPQLAYLFKHIITQEVAYESLAYTTRVSLHEQFAYYLELTVGENVTQFLDLLAYHYDRSLNLPKRFEYQIKAGDAANSAFASTVASAYYLSALEALTYMPDTVENRRAKADTVFRLVSVSFATHNPQQNLARLTEIETMLKELPGFDGLLGSDKVRLARVHYWMGRSHYLSNNMFAALGYYRQVLEVAPELGDAELLAIPSSVIGQTLMLQGHHNKAEPLLRQAIEPLEKTHNWVEWLRAIGFLGMALTLRGDRIAGLEYGQRALKRAEEIKNPDGLALIRLFTGFTNFLGGDFDLALEKMNTIIETTDTSHGPIYLYLSYGMLGWTHGRMGNYQVALENFAKSKYFGQTLGRRLILADAFAAAEVEIFAAMKDNEEAISLAENVVSNARAGGDIFAQSIAERAWATALSNLMLPQWDEAERHLSISLECSEAGGNRLEAARTHVTWGIISKDRGDINAAQEHFEKAVTQFAHSGMAHELELVQNLLAALM